jgi:hypothetical protein
MAPLGPRRRAACVGTLALALVFGAAAPLVASVNSTAVHSTLTSESTTNVQRSVVWVGYLNDPVSPRFRLTSLSVGAPNQDEFQIAYENGSFALTYENQVGGSVSASYGVTFKGVVEWLDSNHNGIIDDGSVSNVTRLGSLAFGGQPIVHKEWATTNGTVVHSFVIGSRNSVFTNRVAMTLNLTISEGFVLLSGDQWLTPMEAKLTIGFSDILFASQDSLALQLGITSGESLQIGDGSWDEENHFRSNEGAVNVTNASSPVAFFSWSNVARVNGQSAAVTPAFGANASDGGHDLYLSYPNTPPTSAGMPVSVLHDPAIGVVSAAYESKIGQPASPSLQGDLALYVLTAAIVAGVVAANAYLIRRRTR